LKKLVANGVFYPTAYIIVKIKNISRIEDLKRLKEFESYVKISNIVCKRMRKKTNEAAFISFLDNSIKTYNKKLIDIQNEFNKLG
jgi:AAA+ ATPase superfamily predicted ATPase